MNDLVLSSEFQKSFPSMADAIRTAAETFINIHDFEDVKRVFLLGNGLSRHTSRNYLQSVKGMFEYSKGLNPLQWDAGWLEQFYDHETARGLSKNSCYGEMMGLSKFFAGIEKQIPFYESPFNTMSKTLHRKLFKRKKGNRTKKAMTLNEVKKLFDFLKVDETESGRRNYAVIFTLVTSGLRAAELCQLTWGDVCYDPEGECWMATFIGKGDREAEQELYTDAVTVCYEYFESVWHRKPEKADALFWTQPSFNGDPRRPISYHTLWHSIAAVGRMATEAGVLKRDLQFSPHLFRRTYATLLYKLGMGLRAIQNKTRHTSIEVLAKHYIDDGEKASGYFEKAFA